MPQYYQLAVLLFAIVGTAIRYERRLTTIENLLKNHLAHHEGFEDKLSKLLEVLVVKDKD
jgi:hypothetical protein